MKKEVKVIQMYAAKNARVQEILEQMRLQIIENDRRINLMHSKFKLI
ncbi:hypothetical protein ACXGQW_05515 [Wenyingzhuangia sp. IMCC45533]